MVGRTGWWPAKQARATSTQERDGRLSECGATSPRRSVWGWVAAYASALVILLIAQPVGLDLKVYREGAWALLDGGAGLYAPTLGAVGDPGLPFTYPPIAAWVFVPLAIPPFWVSYVVLTAVSVGLAHLVACDLGTRLSRTFRLRLPPWALTLFLFVTSPFLDSLTYGQINIILMAACYLALASSRRWSPFGVAVGLTASIKLTPLALLLLPLMARRWRSIVIGIGAFVLAQCVSLAAYPELTVQYWTSVVWDPSRVGDVGFVDNLSLRGVLERAGLPTAAWALLVALVIALSALALTRCLRVQPAITSLGIAASCMVLISPISWTHHFIWWPVIVVSWLGQLPDRHGQLTARVLAACSVALPLSLLVSPKILVRFLSVPPSGVLADVLAAVPAAVLVVGTAAACVVIRRDVVTDPCGRG